MDALTPLTALILGVVEGLTEFLPISSTGHLILAGDLLVVNSEKGRIFEIVIQCGAILAVVWEYRVRLWSVAAQLPYDRGAQRFAANLLVAFIPLAVAFIVGGLIILWAERRKHVIRIQNVEDMRWTDALKVGIAQTFALIPGTSRAGSTIIGGLFFGLSRKAATEFSFFLAIPVLFAASAYELVRNRQLFFVEDLGIFGIGLAAAFASAFLCVRWLLRYISRHDFTAFAWYRIGFGILVLLTAYTGAVSWTVG